MTVYNSFNYHASMMGDTVRNDAYYRALKSVITKDSVVLDLGAGLGIHGLMAAKLGAKKVYLVEPADVIHVAKRFIKANGLEDSVEWIQGRIEDVTLPEKVDIIVSVLTGNFLLEEDLLPTLFYARDRYLKPGGHLVPDAAVMEAAPVSLPDFYDRHIDIWSESYFGLDLSVARKHAANHIYFDRAAGKKATQLASPMPLGEFDFMAIKLAECQAKVEFSATDDAVCHGFVGWFKIRLGSEWLSTAPHEPSLHWRPAFLPLDPPMELASEHRLEFSLTRLSKGPWTWNAKSGSQNRTHSTFIGRQIKKAAF